MLAALPLFGEQLKLLCSCILSSSLKIPECDWPNLSGIDETTYQTAKKIELLAAGLTANQFTEAVSIAIDFIGRYSILSPQLVQESDRLG